MSEQIYSQDENDTKLMATTFFDGNARGLQITLGPNATFDDLGCNVAWITLTYDEAYRLAEALIAKFPSRDEHVAKKERR